MADDFLSCDKAGSSWIREGVIHAGLSPHRLHIWHASEVSLCSAGDYQIPLLCRTKYINNRLWFLVIKFKRIGGFCPLCIRHMRRSSMAQPVPGRRISHGSWPPYALANVFSGIPPAPSFLWPALCSLLIHRTEPFPSTASWKFHLMTQQECVARVGPVTHTWRNN